MIFAKKGWEGAQAHLAQQLFYYCSPAKPRHHLLERPAMQSVTDRYPALVSALLRAPSPHSHRGLLSPPMGQRLMLMMMVPRA